MEATTQSLSRDMACFAGSPGEENCLGSFPFLAAPSSLSVE
jgi:hypothetical protein